MALDGFDKPDTKKEETHPVLTSLLYVATAYKFGLVGKCRLFEEYESMLSQYLDKEDDSLKSAVQETLTYIPDENMTTLETLSDAMKLQNLKRISIRENVVIDVFCDVLQHSINNPSKDRIWGEKNRSFEECEEKLLGFLSFENNGLSMGNEEKIAKTQKLLAETVAPITTSDFVSKVKRLNP